MVRRAPFPISSLPAYIGHSMKLLCVQIVTMFGVLMHISISTLALKAYIIYTDLKVNRKNDHLYRGVLTPSRWKDFPNISEDRGLQATILKFAEIFSIQNRRISAL